ncbi:hypothetical protein JCM10908_004185 [Rhodotorula pacifica]|uniref:macro domain-containing protein n=1 Tax=Rhodotorula pacifica TaxID=1495444 RepID=UPI00317F4360
MATKRSPSPAVSEEPPSTKAKTDSQSSEASADTPVVEEGAAAPPASSSTSSAPNVGALDLKSTPEGEKEDAGKDAVKPGEKKEADSREDSDDSDSDDGVTGAKDKGITVDKLETIKTMYDSHKLFGYEDPNDIVHPHSAELNEKLILWQGDLTKLQVDCIVNAANKSLLGGGGVDGAIHSAAGPDLLTACRKLKGAQTGETKLTRGFRLPASHIAHTVGPIYARSKKDQCEKQLRSCYKTTLDLCAEKGLRTVAFSGISTGVYGYPITAAAEVACDEVRNYLEGENGSKINKVIFCVFRQVDLNSYIEVIPAYFPPPLGTALASDAEPSQAGEEEGDVKQTETATVVSAQEGQKQYEVAEEQGKAAAGAATAEETGSSDTDEEGKEADPAAAADAVGESSTTGAAAEEHVEAAAGSPMKTAD